KKHAHGVEGHKDAMVRAVLALFADLRNHADHLEIHVVQQNRAAHGWFAGEHILQELPAHHGHTTMLAVVFVIEPPPRFDRHVANLAVLGNHAEDLAVRGSIIADRADVVSL